MIEVYLRSEARLHISVLAPQSAHIHIEQVGYAVDVERSGGYAVLGVVGVFLIAIACSSYDKEYVVAAELLFQSADESFHLAVEPDVGVLKLHLALVYRLVVKVSGVVCEVEQVGCAVKSHAAVVDAHHGHVGYVGVYECACLVLAEASCSAKLVGERLLYAAVHEITEVARQFRSGSPHLVVNLLGGRVYPVVG